MEAVENTLQVFDGYAIYGPCEPTYGEVMYGFDLDGTILESGRTFTDTFVLYAVMLKVLRLLRGRPVVIFTNQGGIKTVDTKGGAGKGGAEGKLTLDRFIDKLKRIFAEIGYPIITFIALSERYRKPSPMMYREYFDGYAPEINRGYFVGDASTSDDFADSDYRFALNCGLKYVHAISLICTANTSLKCDDPYDKLVDVDRFLEAHVMDVPPIRPDVRSVFGEVGANNLPQHNLPAHSAVVVLVGPPGCGKSTFARTTGCAIIHRDGVKYKTHPQIIKLLKSMVQAKPTPLHTYINTIIIDATHPDIASRADYIKIAHDAGMRCICVAFDIDREIAARLNWIRAVGGGSFVPGVAYGVYAKKYVAPTVEEGFDEVRVVHHITYDPAVTPEWCLDLY
jgi:bifunctional polynucleotide phosphatase/kinase